MSMVRLIATATLVCLAACGRAASPEDATAPVTTPVTAPETAVPTPAVTTGVGAAPEAPPTADATDDFAGWYYEKDGKALLQACGQFMPLRVSDPALLRRLQAKRGGGTEPVYVRLSVSLTTGSQLNIVQVQQFGVDEGPAPNCALPGRGG